MLKLPCVTRWNSLFDSLTGLLEHGIDKVNFLCNKLELQNFTKDEWTFLEEYCEVLRPLAMGIDFLQGQDNCYYGFVLPTLLQIKNDTLNLQITKLQFAKPLAMGVLAVLEKRFGHLLNQDIEEVEKAMLATVSHPVCKMGPIMATKREELERILLMEAKMLGTFQFSYQLLV